MRLIDVAAILDIETNIDQGKEVDTTHEIFGEFYGPDLDEKEYAILSHCWGVARQGEKEVSFQEMEKFVAMSEGKKTEIRGRTGYKKIIDTCCINKESSSELSEAINSMYKWYANAELCYAYLHDTVGNSWTSRRGSMAPPKWFSRGWTLQELIAPKVVRFFDQEWERTGDKAELADVLSRITQIPWQVLKEGLQKAFSMYNFPRPNVAQIFSWAANRTTSREEDRAYSLLGLLGVHMPMLYGEGKNAFRRLQLEIIRTSNDQTIFAWEWTRQSDWSCRILADDPSRFKDCHSVIALDPRLVDASLRESGMPDDELDKLTQARLRTFKVTNDGIQIWLPTAILGPYSQVMLGCRDRQSESLTVIHLVICGSTCCRIFGIPVYSGKLEFMQHFLPYKEAEFPSTLTLELQDQTLFHDGFVVDRAFPNGMVKGGSVTLSSDNDFAAIAYTLCFFHLVPENVDLAFLQLQAFNRLSNSNHWPDHNKHLIQHVHFRRSIEGVRVTHGISYDLLVETPRIPGLMWNCFRGNLPQAHDLSKNYAAIPCWLIESELKPGDYGHAPRNGDKFKPEGNIAEFAAGLGLDPVGDGILDLHPLPLGLVKLTALTPLEDLKIGQTLDPPTPLCSVMMPLSWHQIDSDVELMTMLLKIIDSFSVLVGWVDKLDEPKHLRESVTVEAAIQLFVDIFGGGDIHNFIGDIACFSDLPQIMEMENYTELGTEMDKGSFPTQDISRSREVNVMAQAQCINALVAFLTQIDDGTFDLQLSPDFDVLVGSSHIDWMTLWINGLEYGSTLFAAKVLKLIATAYKQCECQDTKFDRHEFLSEVEQIKKWQEMLTETSDEDERRTLVEDTVGKVVDQYVNDEAVKQRAWPKPSDRLFLIRGVFLKAIDYVPGDNPLQRMMDDAAHGVSKHQLLLSQQAKMAALSNGARHNAEAEAGG
ncbi:hypothetical protein EDC04DRAFT_2608974 [Pisolithus marmoratus]|nr:hypothetical protein EDC04DRAFT_2608974 [Pisolithus marmoratus]